MDSLDETSLMIIRFLNEIGIRTQSGDVAEGSFLPGIEVKEGGLIVDPEKLKYPGDLLHEAGHLAIAPAELRPTLNGEVVLPGVDANALELAAMLWSYAACVHHGIDPHTVFHDYGYRGQARRLLATFEIGNFPGLHVLVSAGMTDAGFPVMRKWMRD